MERITKLRKGIKITKKKYELIKNSAPHDLLPKNASAAERTDEFAAVIKEEHLLNLRHDIDMAERALDIETKKKYRNGKQE